MNGKQLKNSILQWAIQGKLVPPVCRQAGKTLMTNPVPRDKGKECWFTYVIECEDGSFYKGFTDNLLRRYQQHCNGTGADYTKTHKPKQLYYWEMHYSKEAALQREKYLKSGAGREWFKKEVVDKPENFEPASILLDKIRKEKERLIKEKKIKRDKNASIIYRGEDNSYYEKILATGEVKCIDDEVPFEIPKGWEWCRIRDLYDFIDYRGATPHKLSKGIPLITAKNVKQGYLDYTIKDFISSEEYSNRLSRGVSHKGDILFTTEAPLGNVAIADLDVYSTGQRLITLQAYIPCYTNNDMFMFFMLSPLFQESVISYKTGTTVAGIKASKLKEVLIPTPPISEQFHIVKKTRTLLPFIEKYSTSQALLNKSNSEIKDKLGKSILQEAIQGKLVPQIAGEGTAQELLEQIKVEKLKLVKEGKLKKSALNDSVIFRGDDNKYYEQVGIEIVDITGEIPFPIPANWQWVRIRDVFQLNPKNEADDETLAAFIPMEKISAGYKSDFTFDLVKWGNIKKGFTHFANGDVAFAKITPCFQNRKSAIFHDLPNGIGAGTTELKVLRPYGNTIGRWYLLYFLESPYFIDEATFKGTANQQRIVVGYLENKLFPLPPHKQQQRIVAKIEKLFEHLR